MRARPQGDEKLRAVRIRALVRHAEQARDDREHSARAANRDTKMGQFREMTNGCKLEGHTTWITSAGCGKMGIVNAPVRVELM